MLNAVGDIIHASCSCPHTAALCYALEDFVKVFVLPEGIPSCTDKLEAWNKSRQVKLPAVPVYDIDFTRKKHGEKIKQNRQLKEQTEAYKLNKVCDNERASAESFLCELEQWSKESNPSKMLLINTVASQDAPVETLVSVNPLYDYVEKVKNSITNVSHSNSITKKTELKNCLKVTEDEQLLIQENTLLQSRLSDWFTLRQLRITGSIVSPSTFSSAAMKYELDMEPTVINRYVAEKVKEGSNISIKKLENNSLVGIVECKVAVKWSHETVADSVKEPGYPLKSMKINQHGTSVQVFGLKPNYAWYHQIQLQLYVCRSFAKYCDLALLHPDFIQFFLSEI
ncbi:hypothetical protein ACJMK2_025154 [Sinanodonta woodiana]|uniref:Uncharacterized protein n=1 Tax=Sinanodonta woodiana TaxID=1069815 RepID=A0ABD3XHM5_SINWO